MKLLFELGERGFLEPPRPLCSPHSPQAVSLEEKAHLARLLSWLAWMRSVRAATPLQSRRGQASTSKSSRRLQLRNIELRLARRADSTVRRVRPNTSGMNDTEAARRQRIGRSAGSAGGAAASFCEDEPRPAPICGKKLPRAASVLALANSQGGLRCLDIRVVSIARARHCVEPLASEKLPPSFWDFEVADIGLLVPAA